LGVGKTTLIYTFENSDKNNKVNDTNQPDKKNNDDIGKIYQLSDGSLVKCYLYDTNGQEQYNALSDNYYRKADGCLLVYDITNKESFDSIKNNYIPKIKEICKSNVQIVLIGNKLDLNFDREVSVDEGSNLAIQNKFNNFKETSCVDNINVINVFQSIIEITKFEMKKNSGTKDKKENIKIKKTPNKKNTKKNKSC
jgi:small GTP-binding protein